MNYVIFDLEWNGCFCQKLNSHINEIIEFGAIKLDENLNKIAQFTALIRPEISKYLCSSVRSLTSLTYDQIKKGSPFAYTYKKFSNFAKDSIIMSWSDCDIVSLQSNVSYHLNKDKIDFLDKYIDLQLYCEDMLGLTTGNSLGLQTAAEMLNLDISNIQQHRALGDSIITAMCFKELYHKGAVKCYIQDASTDEFYKLLHPHTDVISSMKNPLIDQTTLFFNCTECGFRANAVNEKWSENNRYFFNDFHCPNCGRDFRGKIQYKLKDGVVRYTKKTSKISEIISKTE